MTKKLYIFIAVLIALAILIGVSIPYIIKKISLGQPEDHKELYLKLQHQYDSLQVVKQGLESQFKQKQLLVDSFMSSANRGEIQYVYLNGKKNERYKDITTATATKQDSFMGTIHIKANRN